MSAQKGTPVNIAPPNGNGGIVPPWLTHPITIQPWPLPESARPGILPVRRDYHVVPHGAYWAVFRELDAYASAIKLTKAEALGFGIEQARASYVSLVIHGKNGQIQNVWSYDNARFPD
jgi:hypothetical protein